MARDAFAFAAAVVVARRQKRHHQNKNQPFHFYIVVA
jgi:hypothetical protein